VTSAGLWCVWHSVQNPLCLIVVTGVVDEVDVVEKFVVVDEVAVGDMVKSRFSTGVATRLNRGR